MLLMYFFPYVCTYFEGGSGVIHQLQVIQEKKVSLCLIHEKTATAFWAETKYVWMFGPRESANLAPAMHHLCFGRNVSGSMTSMTYPCPPGDDCLPEHTYWQGKEWCRRVASESCPPCQNATKVCFCVAERGVAELSFKLSCSIKIFNALQMVSVAAFSVLLEMLFQFLYGPF